MANGGGSKWGLIGGVALIGGVGTLFYFVYKMYQGKKSAEEGTTAPRLTNVAVNDPYAKKPKPIKVNIPNRFV